MLCTYNMKNVRCSAEKSSVIWAEPHSKSSAERSVDHYSNDHGSNLSQLRKQTLQKNRTIAYINGLIIRSQYLVSIVTEMQGNEMTNYEYSNFKTYLKRINRNHKNICQGNLMMIFIREHSHMTSDVFGVFLTYLPTLIRYFTT